ncbi:hypothetical protein T492DRAFT_953911 [Pavlovales sp. CCMP2436]|nr:hypothetical protein T492DRAFT_953911 [Pavlovales sp. CCMP2436]
MRQYSSLLHFNPFVSFFSCPFVFRSDPYIAMSLILLLCSCELCPCGSFIGSSIGG